MTGVVRLVLLPAVQVVLQRDPVRVVAGFLEEPVTEELVPAVMNRYAYCPSHVRNVPQARTIATVCYQNRLRNHRPPVNSRRTNRPDGGPDFVSSHS